jgi:molecular chaperone GrpE (heat shock protein)
VIVIAAGEEDEDDAAAALRRAAKALQPHQDAMQEIAKSMLPHQDAMQQIAASMLPNQDAMRRIAESMHPSQDAMQKIAKSTQPNPSAMEQIAASMLPNQDAMKRIAESMQPSQDAARRMAELIQPNRDAMRRIADSLRIDPATIAGIQRDLAGGFDWQAVSLAMSGGQAATFMRAAAESTQGDAAEALADFESVLSEEDGEASGTLYDWLRELAPLARDRVAFIAIKSIAAVVLAGYAEAAAHPPFHIGFIIVLLIAIADVGNAKSD